VPYIGQQVLPFDPTRTQAPPRDADRFSGDGSTVTFTLTRSVNLETDIEVFVANVQQEPITAYSIVPGGTSLTFTAAPASGTNNIYVVYKNFNSGVQVTVPDGSITYAKLANNIRLFTTDNLVPDGSTTVFTLSETPASANTLIVSVDGIIQRAPVHYTVSSNQITFTSAPQSSSNVHVRHLGFRTSTTVTALAANTTITTPTISSPVLSGTATGTYTLGGTPTISSPTISSPVLSGTATGTYTLGGTPTISSPTISSPTVTGTTSFPDGSAAAPSIFRAGDTNTGVFFPAADTAAISTGGSERMRIDSSGNVKFVGSISVGNTTPTTSGAGISFPAAQSASSDANTLDDYEEGTWTPGITFGGGSSGLTFSGRSGRYVKIGRMVYAGFQFDLSNKGSSTGSAVLTGLPISSGSSVNAQRYAGACGYYANFTSVGMIQLLIEASGTTAYLRYATTGSTSGMSESNFTNTISMNGMFIYETD